jgi:hypothetical protein
VVAALKAKDFELGAMLHALRRFDSPVMVRMLHHVYDRKRRTSSVEQRMVVMSHKISWSKMRDWVAGALANHSNAAD